MLVLSRYAGEFVNIYCGGKLLGRVGVVEVRDKKVRVGFEFPAAVTVAREEVDKQIQRAGGGGRRATG